MNSPAAAKRPLDDNFLLSTSDSVILSLAHFGQSVPAAFTQRLPGVAQTSNVLKLHCHVSDDQEVGIYGLDIQGVVEPPLLQTICSHKCCVELS